MSDYRLTDAERVALCLAAICACPAHNPPSDLINALAKIEGTDTVLTASRAYPPKVVMADD